MCECKGNIYFGRALGDKGPKGDEAWEAFTDTPYGVKRSTANGTAMCVADEFQSPFPLNRKSMSHECFCDANKVYEEE